MPQLALLLLVLFVTGLIVVAFIGFLVSNGYLWKKPIHSNRVLLLFSGGVDCTAALVKYLKETDYDIHVHHVYLLNSQQRQDAELEACQKIVQYCKSAYRDFEYTENTVSQVGMPLNDMETTRFIAAQLCKVAFNENRPYKFVCTGRIKTDHRGDFQKRANTAQKVFDAVLSQYSPQEYPVPKIEYPLDHWDKKQVVSYLPPRLYKLTWSCREPIDDGIDPKTGRKKFMKCGICQSCIDLAMVEETVQQTE